LKDKDNDLETNNKNKSVRKLHSCKNIALVSCVDTVECRHFCGYKRSRSLVNSIQI